MGFGGATAAMIASLKNNNRRTKREAFSHLNRGSDIQNDGIKVEPVSEEVFDRIRRKMKKQKAKEKRANVIFIFISLITAIFLMYLLFSYFYYDPGISFPSQ